MKKINVLSCFDGMSCRQIALERIGIPVNKYYASEIDKYAIKVTQHHYPDTIQLGSIENWKEWIDEIETPNLLIGGSPCQGFSNAGLGLNFEDPRSRLFFIFVDIRDYLLKKNPNLMWLLENVKMKKSWEKIITEMVGVEPILIDSALVSAQSRKRLYWANFPIFQPKDRQIYLKDIIETGEVDREKSYAIDANYYKGGNPRLYFEDGRRQLAFEHHTGQYIVGMTEDIKGKDQWRRIYSPDGKSPTLVGSSGGHHKPKICLDTIHYRKLTPTECERLQTVEDNWTSMVSNTQRYKMLGNGWTIDVIAHIFSCLYGNQK